MIYEFEGVCERVMLWCMGGVGGLRKSDVGGGVSEGWWRLVSEHWWCWME